MREKASSASGNLCLSGMPQAATIEINKAQKPAEFNHGVRFWEVRNCLDPFEDWSETISIDSIAEEVEFSLPELTFSEVELTRELSKTLKNRAKMSRVLFQRGGGDEDIVNINEHKFQVAQCPVDVALESLTSIAEAERHNRILEQARLGL